MPITAVKKSACGTLAYLISRLLAYFQQNQGGLLYAELKEPGHPTAKPIAGIITRYQ
jgi:hypothetical protein